MAGTRVLHRRIGRTLRAHALRYGGLFVIITVMVGVVSSFLMVAHSVKDVYDEATTAGRQEDGQVTFVGPLPAADVDDIFGPDVTVEEKFHKTWDRDDGTSLEIFAGRDRVNLPRFFDGHGPHRPGEIALERIYAESEGLHVGDTITLDRPYTVTGIMALPDYPVVLKSRTDMLPAFQDIGLALVTRTDFDGLDQAGTTYTYAWHNDRPLEQREAQEQLEETVARAAAGGHVATDAVLSPRNPLITYVTDDMGGDIPTMYVFFTLVLAVMAILFLIVARAALNEESAAIGTLLALGYTRRELTRHYLAIPLLVCLAAIVAGNILGFTYLAGVFRGLYYQSFSLYPFRWTWSAEPFLVTAGLPLLLIIGANYLNLRRVFGVPPLNFLRHELRRRPRPPRAWMPFRRFLPVFRYRVFRGNLGLYASMLVGVVLTNAILVYGMAFATFLQGYGDELADGLAAGDIYYVNPVTAAAEPAPEGALKFTHQSLTLTGTSDAAIADDPEVHLYGVDPGFDTYPLSGDGAVISEGLAEKFGVGVGENILLTDPYHGRDLHYRVAGVADGDISLDAYLPRDVLNDDLGLPAAYFSGYFADHPLDLPDDEVISHLTRQSVADAGTAVAETFVSMAPVLYVASVVIFLVVVYVLMSVLAQKSRTSMVHLRVFGFTNLEVARIYLVTSFLVVAAVELLTVPLVRALVEQLGRAALGKLRGYVPVSVGMGQAAVAAAVGVAAFIIIALVQLWRLDRIDANEVLKQTTG